MEMRSSGDGADYENSSYYQQTSENKIQDSEVISNSMHVFGPHFFLLASLLVQNEIIIL